MYREYRIGEIVDHGSMFTVGIDRTGNNHGQVSQIEVHSSDKTEAIFKAVKIIKALDPSAGDQDE